MKFDPRKLQDLVTEVFLAVGCGETEAECVADHLVQANLAGHDSHGVIRVSHYVQWVNEEKVFANRTAQVVFENDIITIIDGQLGFGQAIGVDAMQRGIDKCRNQGISAVAVRNAGHMGRIGHWAEIAADAGLVSLHFVNTSGLGMLVAPVGGISRRLSANPVAVGIPVDGGPNIIFDISTSSVAEGKLKVAYNKGVTVPDGCIIDPEGNPTNDPAVFYGLPRGAILPFGGHKGYGLGIVAEILAGALTGGGCSKPGIDRLEQGMLAMLLDPKAFQVEQFFGPEVRQYIDWVKSSDKVSPDADILMPGEIEHRNRQQRMAEGIDLDDTTWKQLTDAARSLEVNEASIQSANGR